MFFRFYCVTQYTPSDCVCSFFFFHYYLYRGGGPKYLRTREIKNRRGRLGKIFNSIRRARKDGVFFCFFSKLHIYIYIYYN